MTSENAEKMKHTQRHTDMHRLSIAYYHKLHQPTSLQSRSLVDTHYPKQLIVIL